MILFTLQRTVLVTALVMMEFNQGNGTIRYHVGHLTGPIEFFHWWQCEHPGLKPSALLVTYLKSGVGEWANKVW